MSEIVLSVVVPVYREQENIGPFLARLVPVLQEFGPYEVIFTADPAPPPDETEQAILEQRARDPAIKLVRFSRRFGQPAAAMAGLHLARGQACVVIDVDLQDPPELVREMVERWREGNDVVYAQRRSRAGETLAKRLVSWLGYKLIHRIAEVQIPPHTGDFRLLSRRVVEALKGLKEGHGFLRGLVALVGFRQTAVLYDREPRAGGAGKYNRFLGSLRIGLNGIIGFSRHPLHLISVLGIAISMLAFAVGVTYTVLRLLHVEIPWGNPTLVILVSFLSGLQLLALGIMGEYVGRIYDEVKGRPLYIVDRAWGFEPAEPDPAQGREAKASSSSPAKR